MTFSEGLGYSHCRVFGCVWCNLLYEVIISAVRMAWMREGYHGLSLGNSYVAYYILGIVSSSSLLQAASRGCL